MERITLNVNGMSCDHCKKAVETSVGTLTGVMEVKVDLAANQVDVLFDDSEVTVEEIKSTIDDQGYEVE